MYICIYVATIKGKEAMNLRQQERTREGLEGGKGKRETI